MTRVMIDDRYEILMDQPLPDFDCPLAQAYAVNDTSNAIAFPLFALRTSIFPPPRYEHFDNFLHLGKQSTQLKLIHLQAYENIAWPGNEYKKSIALVYTRPNGKQLISNINDTFTPWSTEQILHLFLLPLHEVLEELDQRDLIHRAIRPTNLFFDESGKQSALTLGECLSSPFGYGQGILFEPLFHAISDPIGRGASSISNDLFALGATLSFLLNGGNPCRNKSNSEIIESRLEKGSYATYIPKSVPSNKYIDLLQGLLADQEENRWTIKELSSWISNGRHNSSIAQPNKRASRPISFNNNSNIYTKNALAHEMRSNPLSAYELISKNHLYTWLKNSLKDKACITMMDGLKVILPENASNSEHLLGVLRVLDPSSPFFWQGRCFTEKGIPLYFAQSIYNNDRIDSMINLICSSVLTYFITDSHKTTSNIESVGEDQETQNNITENIKTARAFLEYQDTGGGVERCLYYLCPFLPCFSPLVRNYNCTKISELLLALDHIASQPKRPEYPLDRHILSFIIARDKSLQQRFIFELDSKKSQRRIIGMFKLLAELQTRNKIKQLPGLCRWFGDLSIVVVNSFKNLKWKEDLKAEIPKVVAQGNLSAMVALLDNKKAVEIDYINHQCALNEVAYLETAIQNILKSLSSPIHYGERIGQNNAIFISAMISFIMISSYIICKEIL